MPAVLRIRLRPPSHPTRYSARSASTIGERDVDAGRVLREARHFTSAIDRHRQFADPFGEYALDVVLPEPEHVVVPGRKVADVQRDMETHDRIGLALRCRADRAPRWCVNANHPRASRSAPGSRAARQRRRRPPPTRARRPASVPSDLPRQSPPHVQSYVRWQLCGTPRVLPQVPRCTL